MNIQVVNWFQIPHKMCIKMVKILTLILTILSFFLPSQSVLFTLCVSTIVGSVYYLMCETQPQIMWLLNFAIKYKIQKVKNYFKLLVQPQGNDVPKLQTEDNFNFIQYYDEKEEKKYIYLFNKKYKSNDLIIFKDELNQDITNSIEPYLGPMQNFHGTPLTPHDLNHKKITIFRDGDVSLSKTFDEYEPMLM
ncbi:hypothetical protein IIV22_039R [Invertebrate iridescent virus 22]|uniref:Uncharacterized protein n=1 Tax=Invertebrate iridescent virus 22 TaxID=345198 RepID=S6DAV1_9VIRU|nr:hypothetical protein IIV22_039R [Invertebrate iridescent virus 22]CCV01716.1 hypothetical protein IIV22_039R [Invertebrate iridescent virus 22]